MKRTLFGLAILLVSCNSSQPTVSENSTETKALDPVPYANTITEQDLKTHLYTYASDEFEGRETGTPGQKKAIAYLKAAYEELGIPAAKKDGDYFQKVPLAVSKVPEGSITIEGKTYNISADFVTMAKAIYNSDEIVYAGYGIQTENYSDYNGLDVTGKLVLVKSGEPKNSEGNYIISGNQETSTWSNMSESIGLRSKAAFDNGAVGLLYYDPVNYPRFKQYYTYMKTNNSGKMELKAAVKEYFLVLLNDDMVKAILPNIGTIDQTQTIKKSITLDIKSTDDTIDSENVVAILKGRTKPNEYVVLSSHLDHIGVSADGQINNGADDDGSGSVALLELAQAFKKAKDEGHGPERSIVFLHVTGEEKGLLGSKYYTDFDPIFPLNQTVVDLNIDMIGRIDPKREGNRNYIYLIGSDKLSTELHELSENINEKYMQIELDYTYNDENDPNRFYYRSDHYNFAKNNIPIIFYFNGTHEDYHKPGDTPDKINYDLLRNRTQLVFYTAWEIANKPNRLVVDKAE
ncbi:M28 family peptidase [Flavobacterium sp. ASW18X]|uniref:M28 family peptidase n=1 Tax=Flavobacterium sp. ASW18X TaxID=2572595 RepID=UPI0010AE30CA|nr:M28 family peptidase [Flavobacterium sp. ASW18X]TKD66229.1 M28 family peptidase [Flavobacterium sp. ASW18X]